MNNAEHGIQTDARTVNGHEQAELETNGDSEVSVGASSQRSRGLFSLIVWIGVVFFVAFVGSLVTRTGMQDWYDQLEKPWFQPPGWLFGPVWTVLYLLMAIAAWMIWRGRDEASRRGAVHFFVAIFLIQLALNLLWSVVFFGLHSPMFAFFEICILWCAVAFMVFLSFRQSKLAGWLLVPYLGWASFALILNLAIWRGNIMP